MKKFLVYALAAVLVVTFFAGCKKKVQEVPPPPQVKEQPRVEKVEEPVVQEPVLSEEEILMSKSLEQINKEQPLGMIFFDYDKYFVRADARPVLDANAAWLKKFKTVKILVEGHADERGTEDYNLALGEKRAKSAFDHLVSLGIPAERMKMLSFGKSQPLVSGHDEASWQKNRRTQFVIIEK